MATLLPSLSSDEEDNVPANGKKEIIESDDDGDSSDDEVNEDFEFGGLLGEDDDGGVFSGGNGSNTWSYKSALHLLEQNDAMGADGQMKPARMDVASIIAAARSNMKKSTDETNISSSKETEETESSSVEESDDEINDEDGGGSGSDSDGSANNESSSEDDSEDDEVDDAHIASNEMEDDMLKKREQTLSKRAALKLKLKGKQEEKEKLESEVNEGDNNEDEGGVNSESENDEGESSSDEEEEVLDDEAKKEAEKAAAYFESSGKNDSEEDKIEVFAQLPLCRPLLRGAAAMGFVTPTPIQASVIPVALAGRDVCASAVTGSGKTAAFLLPMMERIIQRRSSKVAAIKALILTPTRELAAQCLGMLTAIGRYTDLRATLIVGGAKNLKSQSAELRARPDFVVATPGRLLDHLTNTAGVDLEDLEFLVLDEADRLLDLGFQDEIHEIVKQCPTERQTLLFSATMSTKVDDLVKLSLKRPTRVHVTNRKNGDTGVEVALRLEQEFVRVRPSNEGVPREAMLLAMLTRTFKSKSIVFIDTKVGAHRLMIIAGLCGIQCAELHGNLTQIQRLTALEKFREGDVDVLFATDLAARGLDITGVDAVINFEMPSNVDTYVHRIGRTARAGRGGQACTLIGEGRRHLMKDVIKDAEQKSRQHGKTSSTGVVRSRTVPPAVVSHFVAKIASLEPHIEEVLAAEVVAKMDRIADMEAMRVTNIIQHSDDIKARPQREWFASHEKKMSAKEAALEKQQMIAEKVGTGTHRMTRKKRRAREAREDMLEAQEEMNREREESGKQPKRTITDKSIKTSARAQKKKMDNQQNEEYGKSVQDEDRAQKAKQKAKLSQEKKKRKGAFASDAMGDGDLFADEKVTFAKKKAKQDDVPAKSSYSFDGFDPEKRGLKKSSKKSNKGFKSKGKHKRR
eukprot:scaffold62017_cov51-Attheya_sp.AAC.8